MLYLFAGKPRHGDMTQCLQQQSLGYKLRITCVEIQRRPSVDLANTKERQKLLARIRAQEFQAILLSPPCSTFSRAPWANFKGPRPVRSAAKPRGLDKLTAAERDRCILGNIFADFTWEVVELAIEVHVSFLLLEQPEDLGMLARGPYTGQRPASMWQWPAKARVAKLPGVTTATRLLLLGARHLPNFCYVGPPTYNSDGSYIGLPRLHSQPSMRHRATSGPFKTTGTEQWPIRMCQWIAAMLLDTCSAAATTANGGREAENRTDNVEDNDESYPVCKPEGHRLQGGKGPPSACETLAGYKDFHDGGGLCSPGRWRKEVRELADGATGLATPGDEEDDAGVRGFGKGARA